MKSKSAAIPTLDAYLDRIGRTERGAEFDAFSDLARRTLNRVEPSEPHLAIMLRALKIMAVATVEFGLIEVDSGATVDKILPPMARAMGWAVMSAVASASETDKPPPRSFARLFAEEFRQGALAMLDSYDNAGAA